MDANGAQKGREPDFGKDIVTRTQQFTRYTPPYVIARVLRACLDATVPFRSPIQTARFLPCQDEKNALFTVETVAERDGTVASKQAIKPIRLVLSRTTSISTVVVDGNPLHLGINLKFGAKKLKLSGHSHSGDNRWESHKRQFTSTKGISPHQVPSALQGNAEKPTGRSLF